LKSLALTFRLDDAGHFLNVLAIEFSEPRPSRRIAQGVQVKFLIED